MPTRSFGSSLATVAVLLIIVWPAQISALNFEITPPDPVIKIPGVSDFVAPTDLEPCAEAEAIGADGCITIPWIGQYITGLYRFAVLATTIVAVVVMMVSGYLWLTAAGNVERVSSARGYIGGALTGLMLMLGSYTILNLINPKLVTFEGLRIPVVKKISLDVFVEELYKSGDLVGDCLAHGTNDSLTTLAGTDLSPELQSAFNEAGQTYGLSPAFVASIAAWETRGCFNYQTSPCAGQAKISKKGAAGVAQILPGTAGDIWNRYSTGTVARPMECSGDDDPGRTGRYTSTCAKWMDDHPREVILMSAAYLKKYVQPQLARCGYGQNLGILAAGYNAGPGATGLCNGVPHGQENREYVTGSKGFYTKYCSQSGGQTKQLSESELKQPYIEQVFPGMFTQ